MRGAGLLLAAAALIGAAGADCDDVCWADEGAVDEWDCVARPEPLQVLRHDDDDPYTVNYLDTSTGERAPERNRATPRRAA